LHPGLEAVYHHDRHRCLRHPGDGPAQLRVGARPGPASAAPTERQRAVLPLRPARLLARGARHDAYPRQALSPDDPGQDRALPPLHEEPDPARELLPAGPARTAPGRVRRSLQLAALPRKPQQPNPGRRLLRPRSNHPGTERKHQAENHRATTPAAPSDCSFNFNSDGPDPLLIPLLTCPKGSDDVHSTWSATASTVAKSAGSLLITPFLLRERHARTTSSDHSDSATISRATKSTTSVKTL